jgi:hypothetical protein
MSATRAFIVCVILSLFGAALARTLPSPTLNPPDFYSFFAENDVPDLLSYTPIDSLRLVEAVKVKQDDIVTLGVCGAGKPKVGLNILIHASQLISALYRMSTTAAL